MGQYKIAPSLQKKGQRISTFSVLFSWQALHLQTQMLFSLWVMRLAYAHRDNLLCKRYDMIARLHQAVPKAHHNLA